MQLATKPKLGKFWVIQRNLGPQCDVPLYFRMIMLSGMPVTSFRFEEAHEYNSEGTAKAVIQEWALDDRWQAVEYERI